VSLRAWQTRIEDILAASSEIGTFIAGLNYDQFCADAKTLKAVTADLMIIGEAAGRIPDVIVGKYPEVPWHLMRGMRNRIVHAYFSVDSKIVWDTCVKDLPLLAEPLNKILQENPRT
jgi:uncharacterized protein with HEPN domain